MNVLDAIYMRRSVRKYRMEPVDEKIVAGIFRFLSETEPLFPEIRTEIRIFSAWNQKQKFSGIVNAAAPHYLAIYTEEKEKSEMKAGYIMQQIVLYLTMKGLGTCYQGLAKKKDEKLEEEGLHLAMVLAFGYPKAAVKAGESKRIALEDLCAFKEEPKAATRKLLEAARMAPSSFNSQPWRFVVYENRIHIFARKSLFGQQRKGKAQEFNFGVLLANMMEAAEELWIDAEPIKLDNITHITLPNNQYIMSVLL